MRAGELQCYLKGAANLGTRVGAESERRRGGCSCPIRTELRDDRWVPPAGPTSQRAAARGRGRVLGRCCAATAGAGVRDGPQRPTRADGGGEGHARGALGRGEKPAQRGEG